MKIFNKNFIRFVSSFLGIIFITLLFVFVAGFYESEMTAGGSGNMEVMKDEQRNRGAVNSANIQNPDETPKILKGRGMDWEPEYPPRLE